MTGRIIEWDDEKKEYVFTDNSLGTFQNSFTMGSVVKGATLLAGYNANATTLGQVRLDEKMSFLEGYGEH